MPPRRAFRQEYRVPGIDSPRAIANARLLLVGAVKLDHLQPDQFARLYRLKPATAARMIEEERARRNG